MVLVLLGYIAFVIFVVAVLMRVIHFANTPTHLRWELYPVPHEDPRRAHYGGSYMEEVDWWTKTQQVSHVNELIDMLGEMLLIKALYKHRFKQWIVSFPFHLGLYLLMGLIALLFLGGLAGALGVDLTTGALALVVGGLTGFTAFAGFALMMLGAAGLLVRRLIDPDLRDFTGPIDLFNLLLFIVLGVLGLGTMALDPAGTELRGYFQSMLTLAAPTDLSALTTVTVIYACAVVAYIPLTHMSHFVAKYFTWHSVRWNDAALRPGNAIDTAIQEQLQYKVSWSADHIGSNGERTWAEVATTNPFKEEGK
jgi:nitrate reductase gamma subunit